MAGKLLALDIATRTGIALGDPSSGVPRVELDSWQLPKGQPIPDRCAALAARIVDLTSRHRIDYVAIEVPMAGGIRMVKRVVETPMGPQEVEGLSGSITTQILLWALNGAAVAIVSQLKIPWRPIGVKEWRANVLGNGNIKGEDAKRRCKDLAHRYNIDCRNVDMAEALGIFLYMNNSLRTWQAEDALRAKLAA